MNPKQERPPKNCRYIRIPKAILHDPSLIPEAKLLYGAIADRANLSAKNGDAWRDSDGNVFVYYTIEEAMRTCGCGKDKARKAMDNLEGAGLIARRRCGCGKPYQITLCASTDSASDTDHKRRQHRNIMVAEFAHNKPDLINPDPHYPNSNYTDERETVQEQIKSNIDYSTLQNELDVAKLETVVRVIVDAICNKAPTMMVGGVLHLKADVTEKMRNLTAHNIRYLFSCLAAETAEIKSIRGYVLTKLYYSDEALLLTAPNEPSEDDVDIRDAIERLMDDDLL